METTTGIDDLDPATMTDEPSPEVPVSDTEGGLERDQVG